MQLYELKPIGGKRPNQRLIGREATARASLHAKLYAVDRSQVMIGSFNLDPRSIELNTEKTLLIYSRDVAAQALKMFKACFLVPFTAPHCFPHRNFTSPQLVNAERRYILRSFEIIRR